ncbi:MAG: 30S ribosomal protein S7, partial [Patescibacteria group bacterium]
MPRGGAVKRRPLVADPKFGSTVVEKLINKIMESGKKETARRHVYEAMENSSKTLGVEPLLILTQALTNVTPAQEVRSRRVGGANYQIPMPVKAERGQTLAIRWLVAATRGKSGKSFSERLTDELTAAYNSEGAAVKKKEEVHRMA